LYALTNLRRLWPALACASISMLALVPWIPAIRTQSAFALRLNGDSILSSNWWSIARDAIMAGTPSTWVQMPWFDVAFTTIVIAIAAAGIIRGPRTILPFWLAVAAIQVAATFFTGLFLVVPRYCEHVVPAIAIAAGSVVDALMRVKLRVAAMAAGVSVLALLVLGTSDILLDPYYQGPDWYLINYVVLQHEHKDDAMLFVCGSPITVVGDFTAFRHHQKLGPQTPSDVAATYTWLNQHATQRVWYVENGPFFVDPQRQIKSYLEKTRVQLFVASDNKARAGDVVNVILFSAMTRLPDAKHH